MTILTSCLWFACIRQVQDRAKHVAAASAAKTAAASSSSQAAATDDTKEADEADGADAFNNTVVGPWMDLWDIEAAGSGKPNVRSFRGRFRIAIRLRNRHRRSRLDRLDGLRLQRQFARFALHSPRGARALLAPPRV
jgi:hypothetical protein